MRRFVEESNKGKAAFMAAVDDSCAPDVVFHSSVGGDIRGIEEYKKSEGGVLDAFPDFHATLDDMVVERDMVAVRFTFSGTHRGEFIGIPPTNKRVTMWAITIVRMTSGNIVEEWERYDSLGVMQQLGLVPTPGKSGT